MATPVDARARSSEAAGARYGPGCAVCTLLGRKWAPEIVSALRAGPRRFSELRAEVSGLGDTVLSRRLAELEQAGIVSRAQFSEIPPRVEYTLTGAGLALERMLAALGRWGRE